MESKKSQGPSRVVLVGSAVVLCAVLVGAAYFLRDENTRSTSGRSSPATSTLQPLFERCDEEPSVERVEGLTRSTCTARQHPAFMVYFDANGDVIERAGLMVPMHGRPGQLAERTLVGLEMFSLVAGAPAETFLAPEVISDIGVRETRVVHGDLVYVTQPMANVGLVFSVLHAPAESNP